MSKDINEKMLKKLDAALELLENLFILEAVKIKIETHELRRIMKINTNRINKISKPVKKALKRNAKKNI